MKRRKIKLIKRGRKETKKKRIGVILQLVILPEEMITKIKTGRTSSLGDRKQFRRKAPSFKLISKELRKFLKSTQSKSLNFLIHGFIYMYI